MSPENNQDSVEDFFERTPLTLDIAGLSMAQRKEGSMFLGGAEARFLDTADNFYLENVGTMVYRWGDPAAVNTLHKIINGSPAPREDIIRVGLSAVIGDHLWLQALQPGHFDPKTAYESEDDYILVPYDQVLAGEFIHEIGVPGDRPRQVIGRIGDYYVLFEMAVNLQPEEITAHDSAADMQEWTSLLESHGLLGQESLPEIFLNLPESLSNNEALLLVETLIAQWDFQTRDAAANSHFALNITYWLVETFGTNFSDGGRFMSSHDQVPGEKLPQVIQGLVTSFWKQELYVSGENTVSLKTKADCLETDPVIPRWEEISRLPTFDEQLDFVRTHPEVRNGIVPAKLEVVPAISVMFEPGRFIHWGIDFTINQNDIEINPFGRAGETAVPARFSREHQGDTAKLASITCQLALTCAKHATLYADGVNGRHAESLVRRIFDPDSLSEDQQIPLDTHNYVPKPENAVKYLLLRRLRELDDES